ncbi:hypothetical protein FBU30_001745 [Linnemannia zychae]|nr:hypothetical protein FBU30_001745 [Linnemannia zychae]
MISIFPRNTSKSTSQELHCSNSHAQPSHGHILTSDLKATQTDKDANTQSTIQASPLDSDIARSCCLVGANLAYPIGIFIKISRHNVGYGYGCAGYDANINGEGTSLKTRCYMQYMIGSLNIMISLLLAIEVGLSWRMSRDQEYIDFVEKERQELELKEMQRRERAMMIHYYQPNLTLDGKGENDEMQYTSRGSTSEDVLPEYQQRETTVGLGRLVDMSHIVNGEVEEVCPHPYIEVEGGQEGSGGEYLDPSPFSAEVVEVQIELPVSCPMVSTAEDGRSGSIARTNTNNESEADERCEEPRQLTDTVVIPIDQPPTYTP